MVNSYRVLDVPVTNWNLTLNSGCSGTVLVVHFHISIFFFVQVIHMQCNIEPIDEGAKYRVSLILQYHTILYYWTKLTVCQLHKVFIDDKL